MEQYTRTNRNTNQNTSIGILSSHSKPDMSKYTRGGIKCQKVLKFKFEDCHIE